MSPDPPIEVICEIRSLEPICGQLRVEAGRTEQFRGWMDFATALLSVAGDGQHRSQAEPREAPRKEN